MTVWRRLLPRTLVGRVYALYSIALLLFVGTSLGLFYEHQFGQTVEDAQSSAIMLVEVAAQTVTESAVIGDYDTIKRTLDKAIIRSQFDAAEFIDVQGTVLHSENTKGEQRDSPQWLLTWVSSQLYDTNRTITAGGIDYGVLRLSFATDVIAHNLWRLIRTALELALASFVGGLLLIWFPLRRWLGPLGHVQDIERNIHNAYGQEPRISIDDLPLELQETFTVLQRTADSLRKELESKQQATQSLRTTVRELLPATASLSEASSDDLGALSSAIAKLVDEREIGRRELQLAKDTAEAANHAKEQLLAELTAIFQLSPDGLVSCDRDDRVTYANPAFFLIAGFSSNEVIGQSLADLERRLRERAEHPAQWPGLMACFEKSADDKSASKRHLLALRKPRAAILDFKGANSDAQTVGRLLYVRDVTHQVEVDRMKSEFLSHAAHELRTPMASIFGFTELLMSQEFDEATRQDLLATIHKQTSWLVEIINELLDLSRIESRRGKDFKIEAIDTHQLVGEVIASTQPDAARWPVTVELPAAMPHVLGDRAKLRQVLTNVIGNAVKYSPDGGSIRIHGLLLPQLSALGLAGIAISDHGIGMTPAQAARVGERFFRVDTSGNIPGSGLGMAIVKEIIDLLGGKVDIASLPGAGTTVTLWLPVCEPAPATGTAPANRP